MWDFHVVILGLGAFGFAVAKHLWDNNPDMILSAFEKNPEITASLQNIRLHPYFFWNIENKELTTLPENIKVQEYNTLSDTIQKADIVISVIPCQFIAWAFEELKNHLKDGTLILNLAKGIDNIWLKTAGEIISHVCPQCDYAYLAWGMIAQELIEKKYLWADIVVSQDAISKDTAYYIQKIFQSDLLDIKLYFENTKPTELAAALKNITALVLGYYEGKWYGASSLGRVLLELLSETKILSQALWVSESLDFWRYAFWGDLIATCFWDSRNRYLWNMLWSGKDIDVALAEMRVQKKISEGYETLKGVKNIIWANPNSYPHLQSFIEKYI